MTINIFSGGIVLLKFVLQISSQLVSVTTGKISEIESSRSLRTPVMPKGHLGVDMSDIGHCSHRSTWGYIYMYYYIYIGCEQAPVSDMPASR